MQVNHIYHTWMLWVLYFDRFKLCSFGSFVLSSPWNFHHRKQLVVFPNEIPIPPTTYKSHGRQMLIKKWSFSTCQMKTSSKKYLTFFGSSMFFFNIWLKSLYYSRSWKQKCWIKATRGGTQLNQHQWQLPKISSTHGPPSWNPKKRKNPNRGSRWSAV